MRDVAVAALKFGQIFRHRIVQPDLPLLEQPHDGGRGGDHFGERRGVEDGVERHRLALRDQRPAAIGFLIDHLPVVPDQHYRARDQPIVDRALDLLVDSRRAREGFLRVQAGGQ